MDRPLLHKVKESIVNGMLRAHRVVLLVGWQGTGKTTTALNAAAEAGPVFYLSVAGASLPGSSTATAIRNISDLPAGSKDDSVLIIDDFDKAVPPLKGELLKLVTETSWTGRVVIIARTQLTGDEYKGIFDAVVRIKDETAEPIYSRHLALGSEK